MKPAIRAVALSFSLMFLAGVEVVTPSAQAIPSARPIDSEAIQRTYGKLPVVFIQNKGQVDSKVAYYAKGPDSGVYFGKEGIVFDLIAKNRRLAIRQNFVGANSNPTIVAGAPQPGKVNIFQGNDSTKWTTGIPIYGTIAYKEIYPGIDLVYRGETGQLKYEFVVKPGADHKKIQLAYAGIEGLSLSDAGDMILKTPLGEARDLRPFTYQEINGNRVAVESHFRVIGPKTYGFEVAGYEPDHAIVIDPGLVYSTYLGGSGFDGVNNGGIDVDGFGNIYITGRTDSSNFPTSAGVYDQSIGGSSDAFLVKLDASGTLVYATFLGGSSSEIGTGIAVDASGDALITGFTVSSDFPTSEAAFDRTFNGVSDAFVAKLNADGTTLLYSSYVGGEGLDQAFEIAVDSMGSAYIAGETSSSAFPTTLGAFDMTLDGSNDAFVVKLDTSGAAAGSASLLYGTYLGGSGNDRAGAFPQGHGIAVNDAGTAYITGSTASSDFPTTAEALDSSLDGNDGFIVALDAEGANLLYATYLGGSGFDEGRDIAVDGMDDVYVTGFTVSSDFPTTLGAYDQTLGASDAFVVKLDWNGAGLVYGTYLGGASAEVGVAISTDDFGSAYVTGYTISSDFPTTAGAFDPTFNGGLSDAFFAKFDATGTDLLYASYLGGSGEDKGHDIAVDASGNAYMTGVTDSTNFPTTPDALDRSSAQFDAFVVKFEPEALANRQPIADAGPDQTVEEGLLVTLNGVGSSDPDSNPISFSWVQIAGPGVALSNASVAAPTFTAPAVIDDTVLEFQLVVNDGQANSVPDTISITVVNGRPIANAGPSQTVEEGALVILDGSGSSDADGDPLTYSWTQVRGASVDLSDPAAVSPTFVPLNVGFDNILIFELIVNDGVMESHPSHVDITVLPIVPEGSVVSSFVGGVVSDDAGTGAKINIPPDVLQEDAAFTVLVVAAPEPGTTPLEFEGASFAVSFEPSTVFNPPGVSITLPLLSPMTPGAILDLFQFDPDVSEYIDTGLDGIVNPDGLTATAAGLLSFSQYVFLKERVTPQAIIDQIDSFVASGDITGRGTVQALTVLMRTADHLIDHGQKKAAKAALNAFIRTVDAFSSPPKRKISAAAQAKLKEMASSLINSL